jgi:hypothetical protein
MKKLEKLFGEFIDKIIDGKKIQDILNDQVYIKIPTSEFDGCWRSVKDACVEVIDMTVEFILVYRYRDVQGREALARMKGIIDEKEKVNYHCLCMTDFNEMPQEIEQEKELFKTTYSWGVLNLECFEDDFFLCGDTLMFECEDLCQIKKCIVYPASKNICLIFGPKEQLNKSILIDSSLINDLIVEKTNRYVIYDKKNNKKWHSFFNFQESPMILVN